MKENAIYYHIEQLLSKEQLAGIEQLQTQANYLDGKLTASNAAKEVKHNLQMDMQNQSYMQIQQMLLTALNQHPLFKGATLIKNIYPFLMSKYEEGMEYGWHVDSPLMGDMMRTDIALTIFLNNPSDYEGGELELQTPLGSQLYKLNAGDAICYPCQQLHRVRAITKGIRKVAVTWIQSLVKNSEQRKILFDMQQVINHLQTQKETDAANSLQQTHSNLLRMWAE
ncbi:MAG: Fe2+-dependent dioxygenase [Bacteroidia bacterium]|jgi:PKHD-type hydroxylase|nr:Fe2+-dependent dioxygenase [Bacteroidia bacterium]